MEKLKTLKDLEEGKYMFKGLVRLDHLKQEAIKDIKEIGAGRCNNFESGENLSASEACAICEYIKWKNNLIEEDLK